MFSLIIGLNQLMVGHSRTGPKFYLSRPDDHKLIYHAKPLLMLALI